MLHSSGHFKCSCCGRVLNTAQGLKSHITRLHGGRREEGRGAVSSQTLVKSVLNCSPSVNPGDVPGDPASLLSEPLEAGQTVNGEEEGLMRLLSGLRSGTKVLRRIPKGARKAAADALTDTIDHCLQDSSVEAWKRLLFFAVMALQVPKRGDSGSGSLATLVKRNIALFRQGADPTLSSPSEGLKNSRPVQPNEDERRARQAEAKVADGDVRGAIRILGSGDSFAPFDDNTHRSLLELHPNHPEPLLLQAVVGPAVQLFTFGEADIKAGIASFPCGSAGGPDMLLPQHLKDMTCYYTGTSGARLLSSISRLCAVILEGKVPVGICKTLFGATLCALTKKGGGIRPIAVGCVWRRLAAKLCCRHIMAGFGQKLQPVQMGFGSRGGAEAAAHAARRFVSSDHASVKVFLKLDFHNAFNSVRRDILLRRVVDQFPELFPFLSQCYGEPSLLSFGAELILSQRGIQQGDPLGPALFCAVIHPLVTTLESELNIWFLDDGSMGGAPNVVLEDTKKIIEGSRALGLELNPGKCELFCLNATNQQALDIRTSFSEVLAGIGFPAMDKCVLLGAPLRREAISGSIDAKTEALNTMSQRLVGVSAHVAFFLLKNAFAIPKLVYTLRSAPTWLCDENLKAFDAALRVAVEAVINIGLTDTSWSQSSLPVSMGGLGLRSASSLALPAFLASVSGTADLVDRMLPDQGRGTEDVHLALGLTLWSDSSGLQLPLMHERSHQKVWEAPFMEEARRDLLEGASSLQEKARLQGVASSESGAFLNTLPSVSLGTLLDDKAFRIAVALRLGSPICEPHVCVCGEVVDRSGLHGLRCKRSGGRRTRHEEVNDVIKRGLLSAGIPSVREPSFLSREDNKRPDGVTLVPWETGKSLVWDFTCADALAPSYVARSAEEPLYAASLAERNKRGKYTAISRSHHFHPVAAECLGSFGKDSLQLLRKIGRGIVKESGEKRASGFFLQRISVAIQRGNAASILGTISQDADLEELLCLH